VTLVRRTNSAGTELVPGFTELAEIGTGRFATVYRARETVTHRLVALKLLMVGDGFPRVLESFGRESIALAAVGSHPNVVTLFRSVQSADGRPVLVLQLCPSALAAYTGNGRRLPVARVVAIGEKLARALASVHGVGILHRDVKPSNMLLTEFGEPVLADFGTAWLASSPGTVAALFDLTTPHAAPELSDAEQTSPATDVYQLASSLNELIAGRAVAPEFARLLGRATSRHRADRPQTAAQFATELAAIAAATVRDVPEEPSVGPAPVPGRRVMGIDDDLDDDWDDDPASDADRRPDPFAPPYPIPPMFSGGGHAAPAVPTWSARASAANRAWPAD